MVIDQTIKAADDGTVLKEIIIFGRHSIRAPTTAYTGPNGLNQYAAYPYPDFVHPLEDQEQRMATARTILVEGNTGLRGYSPASVPAAGITLCAVQ